MSQTIKIKCQICEMHVLTQMPSSLNSKEMDELEKHYVCYNCIKQGRLNRDDV